MKWSVGDIEQQVKIIKLVSSLKYKKNNFEINIFEGDTL